MASTSSFLSFQNLAAVFGTLTASSSATGYPASNLTLNSHYLPWRSTSASAQTIVIDLGAARTVDTIALLNANFGLVQIQQHTADSWGAPTYSSPLLAISRDPDKRIYRRWFERALQTPFLLRYTRLVIPAQTPLDGAAYFSLGTIWMGAFTALPKTPRVAYDRTVVTPSSTETAALGGWDADVRTGDALALQHYTRFGEIAQLTPGVGDEWGDWMDIDRQIDAARIFCYVERDWGEYSGAWIMRQTNPTRWRTNWPIAEDDWDLKEVVA